MQDSTRFASHRASPWERDQARFPRIGLPSLSLVAVLESSVSIPAKIETQQPFRDYNITQGSLHRLFDITIGCMTKLVCSFFIRPPGGSMRDILDNGKP